MRRAVCFLAGLFPQRTVALFCFFATQFSIGVGCGGGRDQVVLAPVTGRVTVDDKPLTAGTVYFIPDGSKQTKGPLSLGRIDGDGRFEITSAEERKGAVVGFHKIRIEVPTAANLEGPVAASSSAEDLSKYNDPETSGLTFEVKPGVSNQADFPLSSKP